MRARERISGGVSLALALAAAAAAGIALAADPSPVRLQGKAKTAPGKDGTSFEVVEKRGTFEVALGDETAVVVHTGVRLEEALGATVHVLGRTHGEARDPQSGAHIPASIMQVIAIVAAPTFEPPELPKDLADLKVVWITGNLHKDFGDLKVGDKKLQAGLDRIAVRIEAGTREAIAKGRPVAVEGEGDLKTKKVTARRVILLAPNVPAGDYRAVLGG